MPSAPSWRRSSGSRVTGARRTHRPGAGRNPAPGRVVAGALTACLVALVLCLGSCAVVEAPPGGPQDLTAPRLATMAPDSGAVGLVGVRTLRLAFTEKMTRQPAESWLHLYPAQRIRSTDWHGAREAEVRFWEPLPADTVIVVEIGGGLQDAHKVKARETRRYPLSTGAAIPAGRLTGALVMGDSAVSNGVVELFAVPPDSLSYFQQPLLRRAVTDHTGRWSFDWLPVPGGPWLVRAFSDPDANLRPGDREAQRLLPDTLAVTSERPAIDAGILTLYAQGTPGRLKVPPFDARGWTGPWCSWAMTVAEGDTGWVPAPAAARGPRAAVLDPAAGSLMDPVPSGSVRVLVFADVDGDSLLGHVPVLALKAAAAMGAPWPDTLGAAHYLEPWWVVGGVQVPPGLAAEVLVPAMPPRLTAWTLPDSAAGAGPAQDGTATQGSTSTQDSTATQGSTSTRKESP